MTNAVYVIGGAGTGKSTFTAALLERLGGVMGPLEDLHSKRNAKALVTLRGHRVILPDSHGLYLGVMRDEFPGSDGLDRATSPTGEEWLHMGGSSHLPDFILAEGATLATRRFLYALNLSTDLLVIALECDPVIHDLRLLARGAGQVSSFVLSTVTKTENLVRDLEKQLATIRRVQSDEPEDWGAALEAAENHLRQVA
jgi:hypothetical protein